MNAIEDSETEIRGSWIFENGSIRKDENCIRIEWLTSHVLVKMATSPEHGDWRTLYYDPSYESYWEKVYLEPELQGGGPPSLILIPKLEAEEAYKIGP